MEKISPFEYVKSITETKTRLDLADYDPFMVNRTLSQNSDSIFDANQMNIYHELTNEMQYDYYMRSIKRFKRPFRKWGKVVKNDDLELVMQNYKYSKDKAKKALGVLSSEQIDYLKSSNNKGG